MTSTVKLMLILMSRHGSDTPAYLDARASALRSTADHEQADLCTGLADRVRHCHQAMATARKA